MIVLVKNFKAFCVSPAYGGIFTKKLVYRPIGQLEKNNDYLDTIGVKYDLNIIDKLQVQDRIVECMIDYIDGKLYAIKLTRGDVDDLEEFEKMKHTSHLTERYS